MRALDLFINGEIISAKNEFKHLPNGITIMIASNTGGKFIIDTKDFNTVKGFKWSETKDGYIKAICRGKTLLLHRLIMNVVDSHIQIDHINGNQKDNRRTNLRLATASQNGMNRKVNKNNKLGLKGVSYYKKLGKYRAQINVEGHNIHLGWFDNPYEAFEAYKEMASIFFGEYARW